MSAINGVTGAVLFNLEGTEIKDLYGRGVCSVGDYDGDGVGDFAVGAPKHDGGATDGGRYHVYSGATTDACHLTLVGAPAEGGSVVIRHMSHPGTPLVVLADASAGPVFLPPFGFISLGFTAALVPLADSAGLFGPPLGPAVDASGLGDLGPLLVPPGAAGITVHLQSFALTVNAPNGYFQLSNALPITFLP